MLAKNLSDITYADAEALARTGALENLQLEFKRDCVGSSDRDKKEFLADVSAFANTSGGDLVIGIEEDDGAAVAPHPLEINSDDEKLRLFSIIQSGLEPRLTTVGIEWLACPKGGGILIVRIPRSWRAPHRVTLNGHAHFYARNSAGKYQMSVDDIRRSILLSDTIVTRARAFSKERVQLIMVDEGAMFLARGARLVLYFKPVDPDTQIIFDETALATQLRPMGGYMGHGSCYAADGFVSYSASGERTDSYALLFRDASVEMAATIGVDTPQGHLVSFRDIEEKVNSAWSSTRILYNHHKIAAPILVFAHLCDCKYARAANESPLPIPSRSPGRDIISVGELTMDESELSSHSISPLGPILDRIANAFGRATIRY